LENPPK